MSSGASAFSPPLAPHSPLRSLARAFLLLSCPALFAASVRSLKSRVSSYLVSRCSQRRAVLRRHGGVRDGGGEGGDGRGQGEGQGEGHVQVPDQGREHPQGARQVAARLGAPAGLRAQLHRRQPGCAIALVRLCL